MEFLARKSRDPAPEAEWAVWYRDMFDRECPPSVEVRGRGLAKGLIELWARHLFETVRPEGGRGFSRFHLRWAQTGGIAIDGSWEGASRVREWVFGKKEHTRKGYVKEGDARLLEKIAVAHANLILAQRSCEEILEAAAAAKDRRDFESGLSGFTER